MLLKIRGRDDITIGTWNIRTLRPAGKLQELTQEMDRYRWNILGLCEMKWKNFGETTTEEGHKVFFSGKEDKHKHGVDFKKAFDRVWPAALWATMKKYNISTNLIQVIKKKL